MNTLTGSTVYSIYEAYASREGFKIVYIREYGYSPVTLERWLQLNGTREFLDVTEFQSIHRFRDYGTDGIVVDFVLHVTLQRHKLERGELHFAKFIFGLKEKSPTELLLS